MRSRKFIIRHNIFPILGKKTRILSHVIASNQMPICAMVFEYFSKVSILIIIELVNNYIICDCE